MAILAAVPAWKPGISDLLLEKKLNRLLSAHLYSTDKQNRAELWGQYSDLHASRSPEMVRHMERKQGLVKQ